MTVNTTPVGIDVTFRHVEGTEMVREYVLKRLSKTIHSLPNLRAASVEITYEQTKPVEGRYVVQVTLSADGTSLRAEERGRDPNTTVDLVHELLERRIRDWKGRVYFERRRQASAYKDATDMEATALPPTDKTGQILRMKSHETKPMFPEDAVEQMELLGHDFFFFLNADTGKHNVLYRRRAGGYGLIEPAIPEAAEPAGSDEEIGGSEL